MDICDEMYILTCLPTAKTQINLRILVVWSGSSLGAVRLAKNLKLRQADRKGSEQPTKILRMIRFSVL